MRGVVGMLSLNIHGCNGEGVVFIILIIAMLVLAYIEFPTLLSYFIVVLMLISQSFTIYHLCGWQKDVTSVDTIVWKVISTMVRVIWVDKIGRIWCSGLCRVFFLYLYMAPNVNVHPFCSLLPRRLPLIFFIIGNIYESDVDSSVEVWFSNNNK